MSYVNTRQLLSDTKFYEGYSRWSDENGRYETWDEAVDRVMKMHKEFYKDKLTPDLVDLIDMSTVAYKEKLVLGAQRALQFGGDQILKNHMKMYNCFHVDTKFVTTHGLKSFSDFNDGDEITVLTHTGKWKNATVKSYGKQDLYHVTFTKGPNEKNVLVTKDHRWILNDGRETTNLSVGDRIYKEPSIFENFVWENATTAEQLYWCYGYVYGDGTVGSNGYSKVRLCGNDVRFENRFIEMGFKTSSSLSLNGDIIAFTGKYNKTLPDVNIDSPEMIRSFVRGYLDADGEKNYNVGGKQFKSIQSSNIEGIKFIRECFPIAGVNIISETDYTGQETNYGTRPYTIRFTINDSSGSKYNSGWSVRDINYSHNDDVWCLEVEDDHSFILDGGIVTGNCTSSYADRSEFFGEIFWIMLCGAGAGFSVQKHHIAKLPKIKHRTKQPKLHEVEDSIEGWATALDVLMASFFEGGGKYPEYEGRRVYFDLSKIRPKGALISGGFKAPGPEPLRLALDKIEYLLQGITLNTKKNGIELTPIQVYDIVMYAADAVIAGGVRRSATICLFSVDDIEMAMAKTGDWFTKNPQRGRSNNSAVIVRSKITREEFSTLMLSIKQFGEPGFVFVESEEHLYNPCVEIGMFPKWGEISGWQGCNLVETNGGMCTTKEQFFRACAVGAVIGTLQAGYTDFGFLSPVSKKIFDREALLGVSITGWMNNPDILFDADILEEGARIVKEVNERVAKMIGINPAARTTCSKPSGNASVLLMTASGIAAEHSPMYLRNVQMTKDAEVAQLLKKTNPYMVEDSVWSVNKTDYVISFPVIAPSDSIFKDDMMGIKHLDLIAKAKKHWVDAGTNVEYCVDPTVRHNISNTVTVDNWEEVEEYVFENRYSFAGISFLSMSGDKDFDQAPFTKVLTANEILKSYSTGSIFASGLVVESLKAFGNLWKACTTAYGFGEDISSEDAENLLKKDWVRRFDQYADNYFDGDRKKAEYCLKDVYLLHKWEKIQRNLVDINWKENLFEKKFTDADTLGAQACSNGGCEI